MNNTSKNIITTESEIKIKVDWGYYGRSFNDPENGFLNGSQNLNEDPDENVSFDSVAEAHSYLTEELHLEHDDDGIYSCSGQFVTDHNQHSRPSYTIVNANSGRSNKTIRSAVAILCL